MKRLLLYPFLSLALAASAQHEYDNWFFGQNTGVSFVSGSPVNVTGGQISTNEGCSSISDAAGNLLFYTDGQTVYNSAHGIMPNGTGLLGDWSSSQSALIVSDPGNTNQYYIFTTDGFVGTGGLCYSVVDMMLNGGLGDVTSVKNVQLLGACDEKVTGIKNSIGNGFWIVSHGPSSSSNSYYAFPLTAAGVGAPVISSTGPLYSAAASFIGCMKISPAGTHIARAMYDEYAGEIAEFDIATGAVSNTATYYAPANDVIYGVEFSASGNVLYMMSGDFVPSKLFQFDMLAGSTTSIVATGTVIDDDGSQRSGAIQIASDNKIYVSHSGTNSLGVINDPDVLGAGCNYVRNAHTLLSNTNIGLPNALSGLFPLIPVAVFSSPNHLCPGTCTDFTNLSQFASSFIWSFPGASPSTSTDVNPTNICYNAPGTYPVSLVASNTTSSDTLTLNNYITVYPYPPAQGITQSGDTLFAIQGSVSYQWYFGGGLIPGATDYFYVAVQSGDYNVVCTDANGCEVEAVIFDVISFVDPIGDNFISCYLYPNPAGNEIHLTCELIKDPKAELTVWNALGQNVSQTATWRRMGAIQGVLNVSALPQGVYFLMLKSEGKTVRTNFSKE